MPTDKRILLVTAVPLLVSSILAPFSTAFAPVVSFAGRQSKRQVSSSPLFAAQGAPQYNKVDGVLQKIEKVAEGSFMLHVEMADKNANDNNKLDYKPGHVLALELEDKSSSDEVDEDIKQNGGWMRGPYTVSRSTENSLNVLIRVVGKKSKAFVESPPGTPVKFGGKFKVPIVDGIRKESTQKVVLLSTGVGVGPCVGAIEFALQDESFPPIALCASFREPTDVAYEDYLNSLAQENSNKFEWKPIITSQVGRISSSQENLKIITEAIQGLDRSDVHYHLIGNGQMVNEWKEGLGKAGVPEEKITVEMYFNHKAESDKKAIENIASAVSSACAVNA